MLRLERGGEKDSRWELRIRWEKDKGWDKMLWERARVFEFERMKELLVRFIDSFPETTLL